jgi:hypothetical protein
VTIGRVLLYVTGAVVVVKVAQRAGLRCWVRGYHDARKAGVLPGGYRCTDCGEAVDNGAGYVNPTRKVFNRTYGEVSRTSHFDVSSRGTH